MAPSKVSMKTMKTMKKATMKSMNAMKNATMDAMKASSAMKKPAAAQEEPEPDRLLVWNMVLHCTNPGCGSWVFQRKVGFHACCTICGQPWIQSFNQGGSMLWQDLPKNQMAKKANAAKEIQETQMEKAKANAAMKAMHAMKSMKAMKVKKATGAMKAKDAMKSKAMKAAKK